MPNSASAGAPSPGAHIPEPRQRYFDDDAHEVRVDDDPPPEYSDYDPEASSSFGAPGAAMAAAAPLLPHDVSYNGIEPFSQDASGQTVYYLHPRLSSDPVFLEQHIRGLAAEPPRPQVRIRGTHRETRKGDKDKQTTQSVTDFDVQIDLTPLLYVDLRTRTSWQQLMPVGNFDKVRRGTVFPSRAPGFGGSGPPEDGTPTILDWCRRFCETPDTLKTFSLERRVVGWDFAMVGNKLESLVRSLNYRGQVHVDFPCQEKRVEIWNDCRTNRWRLTRWIELTFYFTFLWLFSWPWLFLRTKRYETVYVEWPLSRFEADGGGLRYAAMSEERWYNLWRRPIQQAVLGRRQGVLAQADLDEVYTAPGAEDFARGLMVGVEVVQRTLGWGGDTVVAN